MFESIYNYVSNTFLSPESKYFFLIFVLFIFPKFFTRFGVPQALISFVFGIFCSQSLNLFEHDPTVKILASLGIISLFLYAGLEIDFTELKKYKKILFGHIFFRLISCTIVAFTTAHVFEIEYRTAAILSLALLTPSAGFILDSLEGSKSLHQLDKFWIKIKAISGEIAALLAMLVLVNSSSIFDISIATLVLILMFVFIPRVFSYFSKVIAPYAPRSEFGFLLLMAIACGILTKKLGVYYLVGAFAVGVAGRIFEGKYISAQGLMKSVKLFSSFFVPFYFFQAGLSISREAFSVEALAYGLLFIVTVIPLRLSSVIIHRKASLKETLVESFPIATALIPNLVFGLVLADILLNVFVIPQKLYGALIVYTIATSFMPPLLNIFLHLKLKDKIEQNITNA
ncbi:MAG: cation:proton antiporter [Candidatus Berkiella sp.]